MSLAARTTAKPPHESSPRLRAIANAKANPMERLASMLVDVFEELFEQKAADVAEATIEQLKKKGWRPPTPSQAYIAEAKLREHIGQRKGSANAPATFVKDWITSGRIVRVPQSITGNGKANHIWFKDVEKHFSHLVETLTPFIEQPPYLRKK